VVSDQPANRALTQPALSRLPIDAPRRADIITAHSAALGAGEPGYLDPVAGRFVFTAGFLAERGTCCQHGCRHCPYIAE
jgi:Family of unknown function (DUF5522)